MRRPNPTACWPPACGMPDCDEPGLAKSGREVDFGSAGKRWIERLCVAHLARLVAQAEASR